MSKGVKLLVGLLGAHVALGVARVPGKVYGRRLDEVAAYREQGAAAFLCGRARLGGADALTWLLEHTDEQSVAGREEERERGDAIHRRKRRNSSVVLSTTSHDDGTGPRVRTGPRPSSLWSRVP